jgi:hypothetical protein
LRGVEYIYCAGEGVNSKGRSYFGKTIFGYVHYQPFAKCQFHPEDVKVSSEYLDHASVPHEMVLRSDWRESFNVTLSTSNNVHHSFGGNESNDSNVEILSKDFYWIEK